MDKNMIKIDDLVRQRLGGGEEEERPGAWLQMRDLLDQKLPAQSTPAGGYNWKRMLTAATGVVLLASLTVGGYKAYESYKLQKETRAVAHSFGIPPAAMDGGNGIHINSTGNSTGTSAGKVKETASNNTVSPATSGNNTKVGATALNGEQMKATAKKPSTVKETGREPLPAEVKLVTEPVQGAQTVNTTATKGKNSNPLHAANNTSINNPQPTIQQPAASTTATPANTTSAAGNPTAGSSIPQTGVAMNTHANSKTVKGNQPNSTASNTEISQKSLSPNATDNRVASHLTDPQNTNTPAQAIPKTAPTNTTTKTEKPALAASAAVSKTVAGSNMKPETQDNTKVSKPVSMDTIDRYVVNEKVIINPLTRTARFVFDTTYKGIMPIAKRNNDPATWASAGAASKNNAVTEADSKAPTALSSVKVKSQKTRLWDAYGFQQKIEDAKFKVSQTQFYGGVTFGVNSYLFGPNNMNGVQAGVRGLVVFDETVAFLSELKYIQRFNNNSVINDNYLSASSGTVNEIEHFFKFSALHSIEMPLAVKYAFNRLHLLGGANLAYNFKASAEEVIRPLAQPTPGHTFATAPVISINDFGPRFSVGGVLGIGYSITPAFDVDFRATKNLFDNAKGAGARVVSRELYRSPSLQLSIGYRFSQRNKIPRAK
ncbi:MAG TPA: outer membrane beta-barrel protein [Flavipsychrobacter sp.]|nr:outer membrane beta-barrel protein [Flavipsychrobacter sp.]